MWFLPSLQAIHEEPESPFANWIRIIQERTEELKKIGEFDYPGIASVAQIKVDPGSAGILPASIFGSIL